MNKKLFALAVSLMLFVTAAAYAQTVHLKVAVPFNFIAGGATLPAGEYDVRSQGNGGKILSIRNFNAKAGTFVIANSCETLNPSSRTKLVFHRYGQRYFLFEVWVLGNTQGHQLPPGPREVEIAKDSSMDEVILLAAQK